MLNFVTLSEKICDEKYFDENEKKALAKLAQADEYLDEVFGTSFLPARKAAIEKGERAITFACERSNFFRKLLLSDDRLDQMRSIINQWEEGMCYGDPTKFCTANDFVVAAQMTQSLITEVIEMMIIALVRRLLIILDSARLFAEPLTKITHEQCVALSAILSLCLRDPISKQGRFDVSFTHWCEGMELALARLRLCYSMRLFLTNERHHAVLADLSLKWSFPEVITTLYHKNEAEY